MELTEKDFAEAETRMSATHEKGHATAARYDHKANRLIVSLHNGVELTVPVHLIQDLADAAPGQLSTIEITPTGLGLHWPDIDADVYVPGNMLKPLVADGAEIRRNSLSLMGLMLRKIPDFGLFIQAFRYLQAAHWSLSPGQGQS